MQISQKTAPTGAVLAGSATRQHQKRQSIRARSQARDWQRLTADWPAADRPTVDKMLRADSAKK